MSETKHIFYFDALRALAILCVVLLHVTGHLGEMMNYNIHTVFSFDGVFETFANNFFRIGVDLFLMISGALLLGRNWEVREFFKKRIPRITKPFLFWSLIFTVMLILGSYFIPSINFINHFTIIDMLKLFADTLIFKAPGSVVYWFFWMMLYVYLLMPIVNKYVKKSNPEYFLIVWMLFVTLVYPLNNSYLNLLSDFISPIGLVVLGYYLRRSDKAILNNSLFSVLLIIVPSIIMWAYSLSVVDESILFVFHRYSIPVVLVSTGVFTLFKTSESLNRVPISIKSIISSIALCSYGMYLIHSQIIMVVRKIFHLSFNFTINYLILFVAGFILSWLIIYILAKIPVIDDYIGIK